MHHIAQQVRPNIKHEGEEVGTVLDGEVELEYDGETYLIKAGESYVIDTTIPHKFTKPLR